jgi:hypothetical protein
MYTLLGNWYKDSILHLTIFFNQFMHRVSAGGRSLDSNASHFTGLLLPGGQAKGVNEKNSEKTEGKNVNTWDGARI